MRTLVVVDIQQLFLAARQEYGPLARVDFVRLREIFKEDTNDAVDAIAYVLASPYHDDKNFIRFLKKNGYAVMRKFAKVEVPGTQNRTGARPRINTEKWSDNMVWETVKVIPAYDHIIIISGNGQFSHVVDAAHKHNKKVTVVSFRSSLQERLKTMADSVIVLDKEFIYDANAIKERNAARVVEAPAELQSEATYAATLEEAH